MKLPLILILLLLILFAAAAFARETAQDNPPIETPAEGEEQKATLFKDRFPLSKSNSANLKTPIASPLARNVCVPDQQFKAYGFYTLTENQGEVNFGIYSRIQYYSLTPNDVGNITVPTDWDKAPPTKEAHKHGAKVDLVISSNQFDLGDGRPGELRLTKSYVLLNMTDEIVDLVNKYNFDGVTIDFRLPKNSGIQDSFTFFIKRLHARLQDGRNAVRGNNLLRVENKLLNVVIDSTFATVLAANLKQETQPALEEFLREISGSVNLLLVERPGKDAVALSPALETQVKNALLEIGEDEENLPIRAVIFPDDKISVGQLDIFEVGIWDVSKQQGELGWDKAVRTRVLEKQYSLKNTVSQYVCTDRGILLNGLTGLTPVLVLLLTLSWVFYDFPRWVKKSAFNLVLWSLLAVVSIVFLLMLYGLPSLDIKNNGVYVILASLAIPLVYTIWGVLSRLSKTDYP